VGSHARGEVDRANDIDLLIVTRTPLSVAELMELKRYIEERLSLPLHHPIHLHSVVEGELGRYRHRRRL